MRERQRGPPVGPQGRQGREEGGEQSLAPRIKVQSKVGDEQIPLLQPSKAPSASFGCSLLLAPTVAVYV